MSKSHLPVYRAYTSDLIQDVSLFNLNSFLALPMLREYVEFVVEVHTGSR